MRHVPMSVGEVGGAVTSAVGGLRLDFMNRFGTLSGRGRLRAGRLELHMTVKDVEIGAGEKASPWFDFHESTTCRR